MSLFTSAPPPAAHMRTPRGKLRARGAGIPFSGTPGAANAITDVPGVAVGYQTLIHGEAGRNQPVARTGVTAVLPLGLQRAEAAVWSGVASLNGNGEMTGFPWIEETGRCEGPITITNTHSVGVARDATIAWLNQRKLTGSVADARWWLPVAAETWDGRLNDINAGHVSATDVVAAIAAAKGGPLEEGSVGGGTGMVCYDFKAGSGSASRVLHVADNDYILGVFVQANFGARYQCTLGGIPVGAALGDASRTAVDDVGSHIADAGSLIAIVATNAPLLPHQLRRVARRVSLGMARSGGISSHYSGDLFLAFSTANAHAVREAEQVSVVNYLPDQLLTPLFEATVQAADEAIVNSFVGTQGMTGLQGTTVPGFPVDAARSILREHKRLVEW